MIIIKFSGGLGNQMFQYALYKYFILDGKNAIADLNYYENITSHNGYELDAIFNLKIKKANQKDIDTLSNMWGGRKNKLKRFFLGKGKNYIEYNDLAYKSDIKLLENKYLDGYWQSYKYFDEITEELRKDFKFKESLNSKNINILKDIEKHNSVSIHIRRGDYLKGINNEIYGNIATKEYYNKAIEFIYKKVENPKFYIFSNDIDWCKKNIAPTNFVYINWNLGKESYLDMFLMSKCKKNIIANSTFSWWAAWLNENKNKIVVSPEKWVNNSNVNIEDIIPNSWIKI